MMDSNSLGYTHFFAVNLVSEDAASRLDNKTTEELRKENHCLRMQIASVSKTCKLAIFYISPLLSIHKIVLHFRLVSSIFLAIKVAKMSQFQ